MSRRPVEDCKQCLHIERRDGGPAHLDKETKLGEGTVYQWEHGHLWIETHSGDVQALRANSTLYQNVKELCRLQETLPGAVADIFWAKKGADGLAKNSSGRETLSSNSSVVAEITSRSVLIITQAVDNRQPKRDRVVCPRALRQELIWDTHN